MKYISDRTGEVFDTAEECLAAEKKYDEIMAEKERKQKEFEETKNKRKEEIDTAYEAYQSAYKNYKQLINKFIKDYGEYNSKRTVKLNDEDFSSWIKDILF